MRAGTKGHKCGFMPFGPRKEKNTYREANSYERHKKDVASQWDIVACECDAAGREYLRLVYG